MSLKGRLSKVKDISYKPEATTKITKQSQQADKMES